MKQIIEKWDRYIGENVAFIYTIWCEVDQDGYHEGEINFYSPFAANAFAQGCPIAEAVTFCGDDPDPEIIVEAIAEEWEEKGEIR